ncbi:MFS transporter [Marinobacter sp. LN3S78]|uniref:MFS transporter n=1 Tax=Marinobacter sp. LN3S78 TaxID=3382300 RepID=UPI00387AC4CF
MTERLPIKTYLFFAAQSINLTTAVMSVAMAAVVGSLLTDDPAMATIPYGFQFLFVMLVTYPASWFMSRFGRKAGFMLGNLCLAVAGVLGFLSIQKDAFYLLVAAHSALGAFIAFANFYRFAAADGIPTSLKPRAISLVVAGGVLAAFIGPMLSDNLRSVVGYQDFAISYAFFVVLALISMGIVLMIPSDPGPSGDAQRGANSRISASSLAGLLGQRQIVLAIALSALGYGIMNLLMVQASLHMKTICSDFSDVGQAIQWHVVAMFAPSFFTGKLIRLLGNHAVLYMGLLLLVLSSGANLLSQGYPMTVTGLILLGLGWNFTYVGGGALLTTLTGSHPDAVKIQGINDVCISVMATIGAFLPSLLQYSIGWTGTNTLSMALCLLALVVSVPLLSLGNRNQMVTEVSRS